MKPVLPRHRRREIADLGYGLDDVQEFVGAASKCDFDIDLKYRQILIDAKSLLGVIGIGTNNDFKVCYMGDDQAFDNVVDKFTVA